MEKVPKTIKRESLSDEDFILEEDPSELEVEKPEHSGSSNGESDEEGQRDQKKVDSIIAEMDEKKDKEQEAAGGQDKESEEDLRRMYETSHRTESPFAGCHGSPHPAPGEGALRAEPTGSQGTQPE
ncbi:uncharacterized protein wuc isoform X2 [Drosophila takahashii]|uniref:uncharacterized protein wuc isoform X2 n=1 Tax=Drosophila takahashii TaxID=29030 RepID=UPI003899651B